MIEEEHWECCREGGIPANSIEGMAIVREVSIDLAYKEVQMGGLNDK